MKFSYFCFNCDSKCQIRSRLSRVSLFPLDNSLIWLNGCWRKRKKTFSSLHHIMLGHLSGNIWRPGPWMPKTPQRIFRNWSKQIAAIAHCLIKFNSVTCEALCMRCQGDWRVWHVTATELTISETHSTNSEWIPELHFTKTLTPLQQNPKAYPHSTHTHAPPWHSSQRHGFEMYMGFRFNNNLGITCPYMAHRKQHIEFPFQLNLEVIKHSTSMHNFVRLHDGTTYMYWSW